MSSEAYNLGYFDARENKGNNNPYSLRKDKENHLAYVGGYKAGIENNTLAGDQMESKMINSTEINATVYRAVSAKTGQLKPVKIGNLARIAMGGNPLALIPVTKVSGYQFKIIKIDSADKFTIFLIDHVKKSKDKEGNVSEVLTTYGYPVVLTVGKLGYWECDENTIPTSDLAKIAAKFDSTVLTLPIALMVKVGIAKQDPADLVFTLLSRIAVDGDVKITEDELKLFAQQITEFGQASPVLAVQSPKDWIEALTTEKVNQAKISIEAKKAKAKQLQSSAQANDQF